MGKIIELNTDIITPSQDGLYIYQLKKIMISYTKNPKKIIVPVMLDPFNSDKYTLLDGHHSTCIADTLNESNLNSVEIYAWIAENKYDVIPYTLSENYHKGRLDSQNENIERRYPLLEKKSAYCRFPKTIKELRAKYSELKSKASLINIIFS